MAAVEGTPTIVQPPLAQSVAVGAPASFSVTATGATPLAYRWTKNGVTIPGATASSYPIAAVQAGDAGAYGVVVTNAIGSAASAAALLTVTGTGEPGRTVMAGSARGLVGTGQLIMHGAFTVEGTSSKQMLIRAVGPSLAAFSVSGALADPRLEVLHATTGATVATNDDWGTAANATSVTGVSAQTGAFALGVGSKDAAILAAFPPGSYRVRVTATAGATGVAQLEIFDADAVPRLVFLAVRGQVGAGRAALVQGFAVGTNAAGRSYLIRALGPTLGIPGALADPIVAVYSSASESTPLASNDDWGGATALANAAATAGAMPLPPGSKDAAVNFTPGGAGTYTVQVSGAASGTGVALLEIHEVDTQRAAQVAPAIVSVPEAVSTAAGQPATLGVVVIGKPTPGLQWRKDGAPLAGATRSQLVLAAAQLADAGSYDVVATNVGGAATSPAVALLVTAGSEHSADTDRNFRLGLLELTRVIELYNTRNGTTRVGGYTVATTSTEDGFVADPLRSGSASVVLARYHSADANRDGKIGLIEPPG